MLTPCTAKRDSPDPTYAISSTSLPLDMSDFPLPLTQTPSQSYIIIFSKPPDASHYTVPAQKC